MKKNMIVLEIRAAREVSKIHQKIVKNQTIRKLDQCKVTQANDADDDGEMECDAMKE